MPRKRRFVKTLPIAELYCGDGYRFLESGEVIEETDEWFNPRHAKWCRPVAYGKKVSRAKNALRYRRAVIPYTRVLHLSNFAVRKRFIHERMVGTHGDILALGSVDLHADSSIDKYCPIPEYGICLVIRKPVNDSSSPKPNPQFFSPKPQAQKGPASAQKVSKHAATGKARNRKAD